MKILYVSQYFSPEMGAPAARVHELSRHWVNAGHEATVLTGFPNHPTGKIDPEYRGKLWRGIFRERTEGISVVRSWLLPFPNRRTFGRILNYTSFAVSAGLAGLAICRPDVIIASSPQLLVGLSGYWLSLRQRAPLVFEVRDLWPESLTAVGAGGRTSLLYRSLTRTASFLYQNADHVVVVSPAFEPRLVEDWHVPREKISIIENGVETGIFAPQSAGQLRRSLCLEGKFVVSYIGTFGMAQGLETVAAAAIELQQTNPEVFFLLVGEGAEKQRLLDFVQRQKIANIQILGEQPRASIPDFIAASDACLVPLKKRTIFRTVIPSKMLEFMSCARPVILGVEGEAHTILEQSRGGISIEPEDPQALANAVRFLSANPRFCREMGERGRQFVVRNFSRKNTAERYIRVLEEVLQSTRQERGAVAA